jgi:hypothetical protein
MAARDHLAAAGADVDADDLQPERVRCIQMIVAGTEAIERKPLE